MLPYYTTIVKSHAKLTVYLPLCMAKEMKSL